MKQEPITLAQLKYQLALIRAQNEQVLRQGLVLRNQTAKLSRAILELSDKPQKQVMR